MSHSLKMGALILKNYLKTITFEVPVKFYRYLFINKDKQVQFQITDTAIVRMFLCISRKLAKLHLKYLEFTLLELKMLSLHHLFKIITSKNSITSKFLCD